MRAIDPKTVVSSFLLDARSAVHNLDLPKKIAVAAATIMGNLPKFIPFPRMQKQIKATSVETKHICNHPEVRQKLQPVNMQQLYLRMCVCVHVFARTNNKTWQGNKNW